MGKMKYFDSKSQQNRERLRKHRLKKRFKLNHENHVRERIQFLDDIEIVDSTGKKSKTTQTKKIPHRICYLKAESTAKCM